MKPLKNVRTKREYRILKARRSALSSYAHPADTLLVPVPWSNVWLNVSPTRWTFPTIKLLDGYATASAWPSRGHPSCVCVVHDHAARLLPVHGTLTPWKLPKPLCAKLPRISPHTSTSYSLHTCPLCFIFRFLSFAEVYLFNPFPFIYTLGNLQFCSPFKIFK